MGFMNLIENYCKLTELKSNDFIEIEAAPTPYHDHIQDDQQM